MLWKKEKQSHTKLQWTVPVTFAPCVQAQEEMEARWALVLGNQPILKIGLPLFFHGVMTLELQHQCEGDGEAVFTGKL